MTFFWSETLDETSDCLGITSEEWQCLNSWGWHIRVGVVVMGKVSFGFRVHHVVDTLDFVILTITLTHALSCKCRPKMVSQRRSVYLKMCAFYSMSIRQIDLYFSSSSSISLSLSLPACLSLLHFDCHTIFLLDMFQNWKKIWTNIRMHKHLDTYHNKQVCIVINYVNASNAFWCCIYIATHHDWTTERFKVEFYNIGIFSDIMATWDVLNTTRYIV